MSSARKPRRLAYLYLNEDERMRAHVGALSLFGEPLLRESGGIETYCLENKEDFAKLVGQIQTGLIIAVGAESLSGFGGVASSMEAFLKFAALLSKNGVHFLTAKEGINSRSNAAEFTIALTEGIAASKISIRKEKIHRGLLRSQAKGTRIGRPKKANDEKVHALRARGLTLAEISTELKISKGAVQYSLRPREPRA